jgi:hypothetical protein
MINYHNFYTFAFNASLHNNRLLQQTIQTYLTMKNYKTEVKWAFIFIASLLLWMVIEKLVGLHDKHIDKHFYLTNLFAIVAIALYVFALLDKRKKFFGGVMNYKQGFLAGLVMTIIITILTPLSQWVISYVITPDYFQNVIQYAVESGYHESTAAAEAQFNFKSYVIQGTIWTLGMGVVTSAIVAIFTRKSN